MSKKEFERKTKEDKPVIAICYDFDKTLSPDDMQKDYIKAVNYHVEEFWTETNALAEINEMDQNLAWMYKMFCEAEGNTIFNKETLETFGSQVELFPGVEDWFQRIQQYGEAKGVIIEHYIISSGLKEMIEGTPVAKKGYLVKIYASSFYYNPKTGVAKWPAQVVNYTNKTQFLFRIKKGVLDINDPAVNDYFSPEEIRVPFRNMVYIGDSDTDIPCMKLVNTYGGYSIGVYNSKSEDKAKVYRMMRDNRIKYFVPADYSEDSELDKLIKKIIERTAENEALESNYVKCKQETDKSYMEAKEEGRKRKNMILALEDSRNFVSTHLAITELKKCSDWTKDEKETLFDIAVSNTQVFYVLKDKDVKTFYKRLLANYQPLSENAKKVKEEIEKTIS